MRRILRRSWRRCVFNRRTIPIVAMTANAFAEDVAAAKAAGMNEHVAKPIDAEALYALLDAYFRGDKEE